MEITMTTISKRQRARFYIYKKFKKMRNVFIYKKQDNFRYVFIYKIHDTLRYVIFREKIEFGIYVQKTWHSALRDVFMYKNPDTLQKSRQFSLRFYF